MNRKKVSGIFKKDDGAGLVLALMVLVVLAVLGLAVGSVTVGSYKLGAINRDSNSAYYIAEAGANLAYEDIKNGVIEKYNSIPDEKGYFGSINSLISDINGREYVDEFDPQFGDQPKATIKISEAEPVPDGVEYTIISTGEIGGKTRTVEKEFKVKWLAKGSYDFPFPDDNIAILYHESCDCDGVQIKKGVVASDADISFDFNWNAYGPNSDWVYSIEQSIFENPNYSGEVTIGKNDRINGSVITNNGNITIEKNASISGDVITNKGDIEIGDVKNIGGNVITNNGDITIGKNASINGDVITNNGDIEIKDAKKIGGNVITNNGKITVSDNGKIEGSIIASGERNEIKISGSGKSLIDNIISFGGDIKIEGNININGAIITGTGEIEFTDNNPHIKGVIIGYEVVFNKKGQVTWSAAYKNMFPFNSGIGGGSGEPVTIGDLIEAGPVLEKNK